MTQVRIKRGDRMYRDLTHLNSTVYREFGKMDEASITLPRSDILDLDLREGVDEVYLSHEYTDGFGETLDNGDTATVFDREDVWRVGGFGYDLSDEAGEIPVFDDTYGEAQWKHGVHGREWEISVDFWMDSTSPEGDFGVGYHGAVTHPDNPGFVEQGGHVVLNFDTQEVEHYLGGSLDSTTGLTSLNRTGSASDPHTLRLEYVNGVLTVYHDGAEAVTYSTTEPFTEMGVAFFARRVGSDTVYRFNDVRITDDVFGGIIGEVDRSGPEAEIVADSFERRARQAEPKPSGYSIIGLSDAEAVQAQIDDVSEIQGAKGLFLNTGVEVTRQFSHKSPARVIRDISERSTIEPIYHPNRRLSYDNTNQIDQGTRNADFTIDNAAFEGEPRIKQDNSGEQHTHVRVIGAGEGEHQQVATVVSDSYSTGDPERWTTLPKKDVNRVDELQRIGEVYMEEQQSRHLVVGATIKQYHVRLGEFYNLVHGPLELDETGLSAVYVRRLDDADGLRYECDFSTRRRGRYDNREEKDRLDITNYNTAAEGVVTTLSATTGRMKLHSNLDTSDTTLHTGYPDDGFYDYELTLTVRGYPDESGNYPENVSVAHFKGFSDVLVGNLGDGSSSFTEEIDVTGVPSGQFPNFRLSSFAWQGVVELSIEGEVYRQLTTD